MTSPLQMLKEDLVTSGSRLGSGGFHSLFMYRFGVWRDAMVTGLPRKILRLPYVLLHRHARRSHKIELHYTAGLGRRVRLSDAGDITIGNGAVIGDDCSIGPGVTLGRTDQGWPTLGRGVVLGPGATVIGRVHVGDKAVIGPNAVVIASVPAGVTVLPRSFEVPREAAEARSVARTDDSLRPLRRRDLPPGVRAGDGILVSRCAYVAFFGRVSLGESCRIREGVTIGWPDARRSNLLRTQIGARVDLGAGVVVMAGVSIGHDVTIEPNVVVVDDVPPETRVRSVPAQSFGALPTESHPDHE